MRRRNGRSQVSPLSPGTELSVSQENAQPASSASTTLTPASSSMNCSSDNDLFRRRPKRFRSKVLNFWDFESISNLTTEDGEVTAVTKGIPGQDTIILQDKIVSKGNHHNITQSTLADTKQSQRVSKKKETSQYGRHKQNKNVVTATDADPSTKRKGMANNIQESLTGLDSEPPNSSKRSILSSAKSQTPLKDRLRTRHSSNLFSGKKCKKLPKDTIKTHLQKLTILSNTLTSSCASKEEVINSTNDHLTSPLNKSICMSTCPSRLSDKQDIDPRVNHTACNIESPISSRDQHTQSQRSNLTNRITKYKSGILSDLKASKEYCNMNSENSDYNISPSEDNVFSDDGRNTSFSIKLQAADTIKSSFSVDTQNNRSKKFCNNGMANVSHRNFEKIITLSSACGNTDIFETINPLSSAMETEKSATAVKAQLPSHQNCSLNIPPKPAASASEDQGYSTESDTSSLYTCGGSLVFALKEEDHPTGEVYVSKGLKTPKINTFLLVFGSGYITFEAPMDMVFIVANGNGSLHLVTGGSSGGGVSGVLLVQLKPETEVVISKGTIVTVKKSEDCDSLSVYLLLFLSSGTTA